MAVHTQASAAARQTSAQPRRTAATPSADACTSAAESALQRTLGNRIVQRALSAPPPDPAPSARDPHLLVAQRRLHLAVQRTAGDLFFRATKPSVAVTHRAPGVIIQRLMTSAQFAQSTPMQPDRDPAFQAWDKRLDAFHANQARRSPDEAIFDLDSLRDDVKDWLRANPNHAHKGAVEALEQDITSEMASLEAAKTAAAQASANPAQAATTPAPAALAPTMVVAPIGSQPGGGSPAALHGAQPAPPAHSPRDEAIRKWQATTGVPGKEHQRVLALLANPDLIFQSAAGICGMVSVLRAILKMNPGRFVQIAADAFATRSAVIPVMQTVFTQELANFEQEQRAELRKRLTKEGKSDAEIRAAEAAIVVPAHWGDAFADFFISHYFLRNAPPEQVVQMVIRPNATTGALEPKPKMHSREPMMAKQRAFNQPFWTYSNWEQRGHFALTTSGVNWLATAAQTGKGSLKVKLSDFIVPSNPGAGFGKAYDFARKGAKGNGSIIASVRSTGFFTAGGALITTPHVDEPGQAKFVHWVVIESCTLKGDQYEMELWSWGQRYLATLHRNVVESYFHSFVVVEGDI